MARNFQCVLVTPQRHLFDDRVTYASIPASDGQVGVMPSRAPLMIKLGDGPLRLDTADGRSQWFFVGGGFAQMKGDILSLAASEAASTEEMNRQEAQAELQEARSRITHGEEDFERTRRQQVRARTVLHLLDRIGKGG